MHAPLRTRGFLACGLLCLAVLATQAEPVKIIYDTDMASDVDDVGALAILHALADRGEAEILACGVSSNNEFSGPCIEIINTAYGRSSIPIGSVRGLQLTYPPSQNVESVPSRYTEQVANAFPHRLKHTSDAPDAVQLYRKILAEQPDRSVTLVSVGFLTNLANLLNSPADSTSPLPGAELIKVKVKQWVCMGGRFPSGQFPDGSGEYNVAWDTAASVRAINDWPTAVVFTGFEIGTTIKVGEKLSARATRDPIRMAYDVFNGLHNREAWDLTAVLYAVRGAEPYWTLSEAGACVMHAGIPHGYTEWISDVKHQDHYLRPRLAPEQVEQVLNDLLLSKAASG